MAAIAYVWNERKQVKPPVRNKVGDYKKPKMITNVKVADHSSSCWQDLF